MPNAVFCKYDVFLVHFLVEFAPPIIFFWLRHCLTAWLVLRFRFQISITSLENMQRVTAPMVPDNEDEHQEADGVDEEDGAGEKVSD